MPALAYPAGSLRLFDPPATPAPLELEIEIRVPGVYRLRAYDADQWAGLDAAEREAIEPFAAWVAGRWLAVYERVGPLRRG
jgi:hypothetical protein